MSRRGRSERLSVLLKLAALREQRAARAFAVDNERLQAAVQQARQLQQYGEEYDRQFAGHGGEPVSARQLSNHLAFFGQVSDVQTQQQRTVAQREVDCDAARQRWLALHARRRLLDQLRERSERQEQAAGEQKLQRELDDRQRTDRGWDKGRA